MRIGVYAASMSVKPGYEHIVSGHVQVPLVTASMLVEAGHEVVLISTEREPGMVLPAITPPGVEICWIPQAHLEVTDGGSKSISGVYRRGKSLIMAVFALRKLAREQRIDVLHLFGANGTAMLAGVLRFFLVECPVVVTLNTGRNPGPSWSMLKWIWLKIDRLLVTTDYFHSELKAKGMQSSRISQGISRNLGAQEGSPVVRSRVLFWREASPLNGGDIAVEVYRALARKYPDVQFDFAVRPHRLQPSGVEALSQSESNVNLFTTPYPEGVSIEGLLSQSLCVLQPFRTFTIQPQFSILESMRAGVPVVASDIESAGEIIESGVDGILVPLGDIEAAIDAVESMILNPHRALAMGEAAIRAVDSKWNWSTYISELVDVYQGACTLPRRARP